MTSKLSVYLVSAVYLPAQALIGTVHIRNTAVTAGAHIQLRVIGTESVTLSFPPNVSCVTILDELMTIHSFRQPLTQLCALSIPFSFTLPQLLPCSIAQSPRPGVSVDVTYKVFVLLTSSEHLLTCHTSFAVTQSHLPRSPLRDVLSTDSRGASLAICLAKNTFVFRDLVAVACVFTQASRLLGTVVAVEVWQVVRTISCGFFECKIAEKRRVVFRSQRFTLTLSLPGPEGAVEDMCGSLCAVTHLLRVKPILDGGKYVTTSLPVTIKKHAES